MTRAPSDTRAARRAAAFIITVAIALGGVWLLPRVSSAAATWVSAPPVREESVRLDGGLAVAPLAKATAGEAAAAGEATSGDAAGGLSTAPAGETRVVDPGFSFDMVGLLCDDPPAGGAPVTVSLRTSTDGDAWSAWYTVELEMRAAGPGAAADGPDQDGAAGPAAFTEPVWVGSARLIEVRANATGAGARTLRGVRLMFLNTRGDGTVADTAVSTLRSAVATIAGVGAAPEARAMTSTPDIVRRVEWGANESWRGHDPEYAPVKMAFVHHTVNANSYTRAQAPGLVRGIYYYDTKGLKWSDLGYNFLVDRYGTIYEGRYGGITKGVIGAQTLGFNTSSTGIAMIGTFSSVKPPSAMMSALKKLLAWKLDVHHVDPQGQARMLCRSTQKFKEGETVVLPAIAGHRQANYTACPGDVLYRMLPGVRTAVGGMGLPKIYEYKVGTVDLSPNGDGVHETTRVRFRNSQVADWTVEALDKAGAVVRSISGHGELVDVKWDGRDDGGAVVRDGVYRLVGRARASGADARPATVTVRVDTVAPVAAEPRVTPAVFSPNGDGYADRCRLRFTTAEACSARVFVIDAGGAMLRDVLAWQYAAAGARSVAWDGRITSADSLVGAPEGEALLRLDLKDAAGNRSSVVTTARIDRTLGYLTATPGTLSPNGDGVKDATALGFTLTRRAAVALEVLRDGEVVRVLGGATYAAGTSSVTWDGTLADASQATSGTYRVKALATSALGEVGASRTIVVDRYRPRLSAPLRVTPTLGNRARVIFTVKDPYSAKVRVTAAVRNRAGKTVAVIDCGWVPQGKRTAVLWRPPARRTYTLTLTAVDRGGNRQYAATVTKIAVR
jgi:flagellar hook assembly protein FlgD